MTKKEKTKLTIKEYVELLEEEVIHTYFGEVKNGKPHGIGELKGHSGNIKWIGRFKNGNLSKGTEYFDAGDNKREYKGTFKNFQAHGYGTAKYVYYFFNGEQCHPRQANQRDYEIYKGYWKNGLRNGKGTQIQYADAKYSKVSEKYTGYFRDEDYHGQGELIYYENKKWEKKWIGKFNQGELSKGTFIQKYKDEIFEYTGELANMHSDIYRTPHGKGTMRHSMPKMKAYHLSKGIWKKGFLEGKGQSTCFKNKNFTNKVFEYKGSFKESEYNGYGILTYSFGTIFKGEWKDGQLHGKGSKIDKESGEKHTGNFKNGEYHGIHTFEADRGNGWETFIQEFENGELISQKNPDGKITYHIKNKKNLDKLLSTKDLTRIEEIYIDTESFSRLSSCFDKLNSQLDKFTQPRILLEYLAVDNMASDKFQKKLFQFYQIDNFYNFCLPNIIIPEIAINSAKQVIQIDSFIKNLIVSVYRSIAFAYEESHAYWRFAICRNYKENYKDIFDFMSDDYFNYEDINKMNQFNLKQHNDFCQLKLKNFDSKKYFRNMDWCDIFLSIQMEG